MSDTPDSILNIQRQIILNMSPQKRFKQGLDMIDSVRMITENSLKALYPEATQAELKVHLFERYYSPDLSPEDLELCSKALLAFWKNKTR